MRVNTMPFDLLDGTRRIPMGEAKETHTIDQRNETCAMHNNTSERNVSTLESCYGANAAALDLGAVDLVARVVAEAGP